MRPANDNRATRLREPALKTLYRLLRRCQRRGVQWSSYSFSTRHQPVHVRFWNKYDQIRMLSILPDGEIVQRTSGVSIGDRTIHDPGAESLYDRLFFLELEIARSARRRCDLDEAHEAIKLARRYRYRAEGVVPPLMEAAE